MRDKGVELMPDEIPSVLPKDIKNITNPQEYKTTPAPNSKLEQKLPNKMAKAEPKAPIDNDWDEEWDD